MPLKIMAQLVQDRHSQLVKFRRRQSHEHREGVQFRLLPHDPMAVSALETTPYQIPVGFRELFYKALPLSLPSRRLLPDTFLWLFFCYPGYEVVAQGQRGEQHAQPHRQGGPLGLPQIEEAQIVPDALEPPRDGVSWRSSPEGSQARVRVPARLRTLAFLGAGIREPVLKLVHKFDGPDTDAFLCGLCLARPVHTVIVARGLDIRHGTGAREQRVASWARR